MTISFTQAQERNQVMMDNLPNGERDYYKILRKIKEERKEVEEALFNYFKDATPENTKMLKTEIGDLLFGVIHLANSLDFDLEECFVAMETKRKSREIGYGK